MDGQTVFPALHQGPMVRVEASHFSRLKPFSSGRLQPIDRLKSSVAAGEIELRELLFDAAPPLGAAIEIDVETRVARMFIHTMSVALHPDFEGYKGKFRVSNVSARSWR